MLAHGTKGLHFSRFINVVIPNHKSKQPAES